VEVAGRRRSWSWGWQLAVGLAAGRAGAGVAGVVAGAAACGVRVRCTVQHPVQVHSCWRPGAGGVDWTPYI
jgi:hypothetical protein